MSIMQSPRCPHAFAMSITHSFLAGRTGIANVGCVLKVLSRDTSLVKQFWSGISLDDVKSSLTIGNNIYKNDIAYHVVFQDKSIQVEVRQNGQIDGDLVFHPLFCETLAGQVRAIYGRRGEPFRAVYVGIWRLTWILQRKFHVLRCGFNEYLGLLGI